MPNHLSHQTSPYLQQHAMNPVDWYPWGDEALGRARAEGKPILLSIGYSACHWCHVMAHESFEDPQVAEVMNRLFVNVKVDREERPDLDQIYQTAHQMLAQRPGGWPLTMFLTPKGEPFFGGTYFPKEPRYGLPGFPELCERIAGIWRERQADIAAQNEALEEAFARLLPRRRAEREQFSRAPIAELVGELRASFDPQHGGFGGAPKFPHVPDLELCLREGAEEITHATLTHMCEGGVFDQLGGGFYRYSVDAQWMIPHFEKMLYDNGPLLGLLADAWLTRREPPYRDAAAATAAWLMREMQSLEGGYYSSLDADSEHEEGKFYVWSADEVRALLSREEYEVFAPCYGLDRPPNFEGRAWHLHAFAPVCAQDHAALAAARAKLFAAREKRVRPGRDEKVLVSWNALAIRGMVHAGRIFGEPEWVASARRALEFVRARMWRDGRLLATYKDGRAHLAAYLDDYAFLIAALLELMQAEFSLADLQWARELADVLLDQFEDPELGGFFFTAREHERLFHRAKPAHDQATPSGNGVAAWGLGRLAALTGEARYQRAAERSLELFYPLMSEHPGGFASMTMALGEQLAPPSVLVLRGRGPELGRWQAALAGEYLPATTVLAIADGLSGLPEVLDKPSRPEPVNGWLCRGVTCLEPISNLVELRSISKEKQR
ncbi:MAG TPA: thioredoxin domain-containing protein [Burkholderiales bacterium]|nr:thioredoxin domain-containing protein [Burkholderiales bacterium]